jgi:hypothetical protein
MGYLITALLILLAIIIGMLLFLTFVDIEDKE